MKRIIDYKIEPDQAALWFLGQSGFIAKSCDKIVAIDPYLSDSVAKVSPKLTRLYPPPIQPSDLKVHIFIVTHDHLDHLDPETIEPYRYKEETIFVGPRFACSKLIDLGLEQEQIVKIDSGQSKTIDGVEITGIYTVPNGPDVIDTAGYKIKFQNQRSLYHSSDTALSHLLLDCAPHAEVGLFCINGKWGNMNVVQASQLAKKVGPDYAIPHHYDLMELNSENPLKFEHQMNYTDPRIKVKILEIMEPFIW